jgi:hypothetical protein
MASPLLPLTAVAQSTMTPHLTVVVINYAAVLDGNGINGGIIVAIMVFVNGGGKGQE